MFHNNIFPSIFYKTMFLIFEKYTDYFLYILSYKCWAWNFGEFHHWESRISLDIVLRFLNVSIVYEAIVMGIRHIYKGKQSIWLLAIFSFHITSRDDPSWNCEITFHSQAKDLFLNKGIRLYKIIDLQKRIIHLVTYCLKIKKNLLIPVNYFLFGEAWCLTHFSERILTKILDIRISLIRSDGINCKPIKKCSVILILIKIVSNKDTSIPSNWVAFPM